MANSAEASLYELSLYKNQIKATPDWYGELLLLTASRAVKANWRPVEDVDNHDQDRTGALSIRLRTMKKGLSE